MSKSNQKKNTSTENKPESTLALNTEKGEDKVENIAPTSEDNSVATGEAKTKPLRSYKQLIKSDKDKFVSQHEIFAVPIELLYIEEGFNIRQALDQEHINSFTESYVNGVYVPPLSVVFTEVDGSPRLKIIDGHHRYQGLLNAQSQGIQLSATVVEFKGSQQQQVLAMLTSSEGRPLNPLEKAEGYLRLVNWGWKKSDICRQAGISQVYHDRLMRLYTYHDPRIPEMIKNGLVTADLALEVIAECDETGKKPFNILEKARKKAEKAGKGTVTRKYVASKSKLPYKKQELIGYLNSMSSMLDQINDAVDNSDNTEQVALTVPLDVAINIKEMLALWKEAQEAADNADNDDSADSSTLSDSSEVTDLPPKDDSSNENTEQNDEDNVPIDDVLESLKKKD